MNICSNKVSQGIWKNKTVLRGLETVSEHSTSFIAATSFIMSSVVRPLTIYMTPDIKKENKEYAVANSISSGLIKFAFVEAVALPVENVIKKIEKNPEKFLNKNSINFFKKGNKYVNQSKIFKFATQCLKQMTGLITAIPKSILSVALIPFFMGKIFAANNEKSYKSSEIPAYKTYSPIFTPSFTGNITDKAAKGIGKILDCKFLQNTSEKFSHKSEDISKNISIATDTLLTASFVHQISTSKKIDEERKKPLIVNNVLATLITIIGGCSIDSFIKQNTKNFISKFRELNKNDKNLNKYIEGINIIRPTLIFAVIYYGLLPMLTTYIADKTDSSKK